MALFFMACGESHAPGTNPAIFMYQARQHRALWDFMQAEGGWCSHEGLVLSAEKGVVRMLTPLAAYNRKLTPARAAELLANPQYVAIIRDALHFNTDVEHDVVYLYGGKLYRDTMVRMLMTAGYAGDIREVVGENRGCGDHFGALQDIMYDHSVEA